MELFKIDELAAIDYLLFSEYKKEFEVIDGVMQHRDGISFHAWLLDRNLFQSGAKISTEGKLS